MKTFKDLVFNTGPFGRGLRANITFHNDYSLSVVQNRETYSNRERGTYEVALLTPDQKITTISNRHNPDGQVYPFMNEGQITDLMIKVQHLVKDEEGYYN